MRFHLHRTGLVLSLALVILVLSGCQTGSSAAAEAKQVVADFLRAGQAGDIDAAYALVINMRSPSGTFMPGPEFIRSIVGPATTAEANKKRMAETVRANYAAISREVKTVVRNTDSQAEQYWVTVEEVERNKRVGQVRYLVVRAEAGPRLDLARSDFSQALVLED